MSALSDCELRDPGFSGPTFTWRNRRESEGMICERLDRCVRNSDWYDLFPKSKVYHGSVAYSEHSPLILNTEWENQRVDRGPKPFRFKTM